MNRRLRALCGSAPAAARARSASRWSRGSSGGHWRCDSSRSVSASIWRTRSTWKGSPEWLAVASASRAPESSSPARSIAAACMGLLDERGKKGAAGSPRDFSTLPSAASTTSEPRWCPSTKPVAYDFGEHRRYPVAGVRHGCRGGHRRRAFHLPVTCRPRPVTASTRRAGRRLVLRLHGTCGRSPRCTRRPCAAAPAAAARPAARSGRAGPSRRAARRPYGRRGRRARPRRASSAASCRYSSLCGVPSVTCRAEERCREGPSARISGSRSSSGELGRTAPRELGAQDVDPALEQPPHVAEVALLPLGVRRSSVRSSGSRSPSSAGRSRSSGSRGSATPAPDAAWQAGAVPFWTRRRGRRAGHRAYGRHRLRSWVVSPSSFTAASAMRAAVPTACAHRATRAASPCSAPAPVPEHANRSPSGTCMMAVCVQWCREWTARASSSDGRDGRRDRRRGAVRAGGRHPRGHHGEGGPARPQTLVGPHPGGREVLLGHRTRRCW